MGTTLHGIHYPELPGSPNVPDDIGGVGKLDATTQAWLAQLDATNLNNLVAGNVACAKTEAAVTSANNGVSAGTTRQAAQQTKINAITSSNDGIATRLTTRDTTLAADATTVQGYTGQIASLQSQKPRGLLGFQRIAATNIPSGGGWTILGSLTFNDPATPSSSRQYRAQIQTTVYDIPGQDGIGFDTNIYLFYTAGTNFGTSRQIGACLASIDTSVVTSVTTWVDQIFTSVTDSQWTVWAAAPQITGVPYSVGGGADFLVLEDVGLSL